MQPFIPPGYSLPLNWTVDFLFPVLLKIVQNIEDVVIRPEDIQMLREHKDDRMLFLTNHPTTAEPPLVHHIGKLMGTRFRYMASRQVFDWSWGLVGKVISQLGAFSVIAGINDRDSFKAARSVLAEPGGKLVLFPEGEPTSGENDSLMPFQPGIAQLGFWAMDDARKRADSLAELGGVSLGDIVVISEVVGQPVMPLGMGGGFAMEQAASAPGISPGQLSYQVQVQVTYGIGG